MIALCRKSFEFIVAGPLISGVMHVTLNYDPAAFERVLAKAIKRAALRSGDRKPAFIRTVPAVRP